jgi:hypothetical protein
MELNKLKVGSSVYRAVQNECSEGWCAESYCKDTVMAIEETSIGKTIKFKKESDIDLNDKGEDTYASYNKCYKTKKELLDYISEEVLID